MDTDIYIQLARHRERLPGGFPAMDSGVAIRILKRLFTPDQVRLEAGHWIGCGLCVATCATGALHLERKPVPAQPQVPLNTATSMPALAWRRKVIGPGSLLNMFLSSQKDRLRARRRVDL